MIKSMKLSNTGFSRYAKLLSEEEFNQLEKLAEEKIIECINGIKSADFTIKPLIINGKNKACGYCSDASVYHHTEQDYVYINTEEGQEIDK